jgi:hypothetical protein
MLHTAFLRRKSLVDSRETLTFAPEKGKKEGSDAQVRWDSFLFDAFLIIT